MNSNFTYRDTVNRIERRSFGGAEVAVGPEDEVDKNFFVEGPFLAGARHAKEWFSTRLEQDEVRPAILILLGAPGNGKSYLVQDLVKPFISRSSTDRLHKRTYSYNLHGGARLTVVNDASIPIEGGPSGFGLADEIDAAINEKSYLVVNINRGILYKEFKGTSSGLGMEILKWIESPVSSSSENETVGTISIERIPPEAHSSLIAANLKVDGELQVELCLVRMDSYSLFESDVVIENREGFPESPPRLKEEVLPRIFGSAEHERGVEFSERTPAGQVMKKFFDQIPNPLDDEQEFDPFRANLTSLRNSRVRTGIQSFFRAGEIASSRRFSYRELWGALALLLVGDERARLGVGKGTPTEWLDRQVPPSDGKARLEWIVGLANLRLHQTIFGSPRVDGTRLSASDSPVLAITLAIDPVQDVLSRTSEDSAWPRKIYDVFYGRAVGDSILGDLQKLLGDKSPVNEYLTKFDFLLDEVVVGALDSESTEFLDDSFRRSLIYWYSCYLIRLCAICYGEPAFISELIQWGKAYQQAANQGSLPEELRKKILTLLLPHFEGDEVEKVTLLPLLDSRIEPLVYAPMEPRLVVQFETAPRVIPTVVGDLILIDVTVSQEIGGKSRTARLELDFDLLREAFTCRGNHAGRTENGRTSTPRIERFRSALLNSSKRPVHAVVSRGVYETLSYPERA